MHKTDHSKLNIDTVQGTALIIDDEKNIRLAIEMALTDKNITGHQAHNISTALKILKEHIIDVIILDIQLGSDSGLDFFKTIRTLEFEQPVIFISGHASLDEVAKAVKAGAYDFVEKPFSSQKIAITVQRCLEHEQHLKNQYLAAGSKKSIVGQSTVIQKLKRQANKVAKTNASVLISGESGTGKELIANLIHAQSKRTNAPFIKVNCSAIPENLIESELFGYEKGAFTGAEKNKKGFFELAHRGTLFLDEIADLSLPAQAKILRVLQEGEIQRLGSENILKVDIRIVAGSHKDLLKLSKKELFREDLYYRLNVIPLHVPSLSERIEDIPLLCAHFVNSLCRKNNLKEKTLCDDVISAFQNYSWPGNIRELKNILERMVIMSSNIIELSDLPEEILLTKGQEKIGNIKTLKDFRNQAEYQFIIDTLKKHQGNISKTALALGIGRTYLHKRMDQLQITKKDYFI